MPSNRGQTGCFLEKAIYYFGISIRTIFFKFTVYLQFEDAASAESARKELHGSKWPPSNPKILVVDYADIKDVSYQIV